MSESDSDPYGDATDAESVDETEAGDDNSVRALLLRAMDEADAEDAPPAEPTETDSSDTESSEDPADPIADDQVSGPPASWTPAEKAAWDELPPSVQETILRRERDYNRGLQLDRELHKSLEPIEQRLQGTGVGVKEYVDGLIAADSFIDQRPVDAIRQIAKRHNLEDELRRIYGGQQDPQPARERETTSAPRDDDRIARLEQQLQAEREQRAAQQEWDAFTKEHPDAFELKEVIASQLLSHPHYGYKQAYEAARKLVRSYNGSVAAAEEASEAERSAKAGAKARRLKLPKGAATSSTDDAPRSSGDLRSDIMAAWDSLGG